MRGIFSCAAILFAIVAATTVCAQSPAKLVRAIKVQPDKAPDCSSLKSIVESVTRNCRTNDEKAIAIYNFMRLTHYHRAYPEEAGGTPVLKEIHCYGWSLCGGLHAEQSALWREMGWKWRFVGWPGHTTVEVFYDDRWHYLDVFLKLYAWMPDPNAPGGRTIAGEDDLAARPQELLLDAFVFDEARKVWYPKGNQFELLGGKANWRAPAFMVCGDEFPGTIDALKKRNRVGPAEEWNGIVHANRDYSADVNLAPGFSLTNTWDKVDGAWYWAGSKIPPCHTCGDKEIRNSPEKGPIVEPYLGRDWSCESYANGTLRFRPALHDPAALSSFAAVENVKVAGGALVPNDPKQPARVTVQLASPYLFTQARGSADGVETFELSLDSGQTWKQADLQDFGRDIAGKLSVLARLTFSQSLRNLDLQATVQNNPFALPYLSPGKNIVTVDVADSAALGDNQLVVTYAYRLGARDKSYEQLYLEGKEIARGHDATWEDTPTVATRTFAAKDLPAKFEIDIPTPKGKHPVFPRMLFVRREIIAPKQVPLPWPENAKIAQPAAASELQTLPDPLLTGIEAPPAKVARATKRQRIELTGGRLVAANGAAPPSDFLRWPKNANEKVEPTAYVIGGELDAKRLPPLAALASARLVVPVSQAHDKAPTKLGVTALRKAFVANEAFDFAQLGDVQATAVVPKLDANVSGWNPPREVKLDVTRYVRSLILNEGKFHGFALRVVPDRGVDDGWTVRIGLPREAKVTLEVEAYE